MLLKSLEIQGFKSFPDKTKLTFDKGITAVVGPNGSGKSNISDAVRWVLGEKSVKNLRGEKTEDFIFGGTLVRKALGFAEVTLTLENKDRYFNCDSDDVSVTRRYYRSGDSDYMINGVNVRHKDVHELFMDTGLGRDGYSMVGQGKIADIISSKSDDRREIFEEAAGISKYRYRRDEAEKKLGQAEENLLRLKDILVELEERVEPLREQSQKAGEFLLLSDERKTLEVGLFIHTLSKSKGALRQQEDNIAIARSQFESVETALSELETQNEEILRQTRDYSVQIEEIRELSQRLEEQVAKAQSEIAVLENDIFHNGENIKRIEDELLGFEQSRENLDRDIEQKQGEIAEKESFIAEKQTAVNALTGEIEDIGGKNEAFSGQIEDIARQLNSLTVFLADKRVESVTCESSVTEISARRETVDALVAERSEETEKLTSETEENKAFLTEITEKIDGLQNSLKGYEFKQTSKRQKLEELKQSANKLLLDSGEKERRYKLLEDLERNLEGFQHSVKLVMQCSKTGQLRGVHGPVSRLLEVDKKLSVAIETALGQAMQNIVVETENDAKHAIQFLKQRDGGRATFLPVSSIKGSSLIKKTVENTDGFVGVASELIKYDGKYDGIIKSLLGKTVIFEDLDYAVTAAKKFNYQFRIVTLDGQVVNAGGSLTGGSLNKNSGLLSRASDIEKLKIEAKALAEKAAAAQAEVKAAEEELSSIEASLLGIRGELTTLGEDKVRIEAEFRRLDEQKTAALKVIEDLTAEKETAGTRIDELKKQMDRANDDIVQINAQIAEKEAELNGLSGGRDDLMKQREALSQAVADAKLLIIAAQRDIGAINYTINEIKARQEDFSGRRQTLTGQITELEQKNIEIRVKIQEITEESQAVRMRISENESRIREISGKCDEIERSASELRRNEKEKQNEHETIGQHLARLEERKLNLQKEYEEIVSRLWDEYEMTRSEAEAMDVNIGDIPGAQRRLNEIRQKIKRMGTVNVGAIEEYKEVSERYEFMKTQTDDVIKARDELFKLISGLNSQMKELFIERFRKINEHFSAIFTDLFGGGSATLMLTTPEDILNSGIEIKAEPPGKLIRNMESLSGGEKALVAISIYFAIMEVSPSPFCVMDEIEAALDDINVDKFAAYLRKMCKNTQFIVITHRRGTMEEADMLYGVTMQEEGVSKLLELKAREALRHAGIVT